MEREREKEVRNGRGKVERESKKGLWKKGLTTRRKCRRIVGRKGGGGVKKKRSCFFFQAEDGIRD